jgi:hypothetical protein
MCELGLFPCLHNCFLVSAYTRKLVFFPRHSYRTNRSISNRTEAVRRCEPICDICSGKAREYVQRKHMSIKTLSCSKQHQFVMYRKKNGVPCIKQNTSIGGRRVVHSLLEESWKLCDAKKAAPNAGGISNNSNIPFVSSHWRYFARQFIAIFYSTVLCMRKNVMRFNCQIKSCS